MVCDFSSDEEKLKSVFKRRTTTKTVMQGFEYEAFHYEECDIIIDFEG